MNTEGFPDILGILGVLIPQTDQKPYRLQINGPDTFFKYHFKERPRKDLWLLNYFGGFGKVESRFENMVYLDPERVDAYGIPEIKVQFSYSDADKANMERMKAEMVKAAEVLGIELLSPNGAPPICLVPPGADYHEGGTCRMGTDPHTSATNRYGQIHGVDGLFVADASVLPTSGTSNPLLTIAALAIRTADYIIQQFK